MQTGSLVVSKNLKISITSPTPPVFLEASPQNWLAKGILARTPTSAQLFAQQTQLAARIRELRPTTVLTSAAGLTAESV